MKTFWQFLKLTLLGGILFLFPIVALIFVLGKAFNIVRGVVDPIAEKLEMQAFFGIDAPFMLTTLIIVSACFFAGLLARTSSASQFVGFLENTVLVRIPGYTILKSAGENLIDSDIESAHSTVLVRLDDAWQLALKIETIKNGDLVAVFVPDAPTPTSGTLLFVTSDRVKPTDIPIAATIACLRNRGVGADAIFAKIDVKKP